MKIKIKKLNDKAAIPTYAHATDAGLDLTATSIKHDFGKDVFIYGTGLAVEIPEGYVGFLKSKSGLNVKLGIQGEGVIDSGYTGSVVAKLYNNGNELVEFEPGDKIIQIVFLPIPEVELVKVDNFAKTERGDNGFGSTGR